MQRTLDRVGSNYMRISFGTLLGVLATALAITAGAAQSAVAAPPPVGTLTQLSGLAGCLSSNGASGLGAGTCTTVETGATGPESVVVSPDGKNVYEGNYQGGTIDVFARAQSGALTQLSGAAGCLGPTASAACTAVRGMAHQLGDGGDVVVAPDGRFAYAAVQGGGVGEPGAVLIFARNTSSGALTQLAGAAGCITPAGTSKQGGEACEEDPTINAPNALSLSPDGAFLYVTDYNPPERIHVFARDAASGALTEVQCLAKSPAPEGCTDYRVLGDSRGIAFTPNGLHAYSGDYENGISVFDRDPATGRLTEKPGSAGCITETGKDNEAKETCAKARMVQETYRLTVSPNGETLYASSDLGGIAIFHVNADGTLTQLAGEAGCITETGKDNEEKPTCAKGRGLRELYGGAISPDGLTYYATSDGTPTSAAGGVAAFAVNPATGALTQLAGLAGCVTTNGSSNGQVSGAESTAGQCETGRALGDAYSLAVSPEGDSLYVAADDAGKAEPAGGGIAVFQRQANPVCQAASASTAYSTPAPITLKCSSPDGEPVTVAVTGAPSHGSLSGLNPATGAVTYTPAAGYSGADSFSFDASDGTNTSAPASASITVGTPSPPPPPAEVKLGLVGSPHAHGARVLFTVSCTAPAGKSCDGSASLVATERLRGGKVIAAAARKHGRGRLRAACHRARRHAASVCVRRRTVVLGRLRFSVPSGQAKQLSIHLDANGRKLLARLHKLRVTLGITLTNPVSGKPVIVAKRSLVMKTQKKQGRHKRRRNNH